MSDSELSASTAQLGAVLTYSTTGRAGVHGMTMGAAGEGEYAVIFMGSVNEAEAAAREYVRRLERAGYQLKSATLVVNEPGPFGEFVRIVTAPLPGMEASNTKYLAADKHTQPCNAGLFHLQRSRNGKASDKAPLEQSRTL